MMIISYSQKDVNPFLKLFLKKHRPKAYLAEKKRGKDKERQGKGEKLSEVLENVVEIWVDITNMLPYKAAYAEYHLLP